MGFILDVIRGEALESRFNISHDVRSILDTFPLAYASSNYKVDTFRSMCKFELLGRYIPKSIVEITKAAVLCPGLAIASRVVF